jgi:hypothetical protein
MDRVVAAAVVDDADERRCCCNKSTMRISCQESGAVLSTIDLLDSKISSI